MHVIRSKNDFDFVKTSKNVRTVVGGRYWAVRRGPGEWCAHHRDSEPTFIGRSTSFDEAESTFANHAEETARAFYEATGVDAGDFDECYDCAGDGFSGCQC